jgi:hypothetical protein
MPRDRDRVPILLPTDLSLRTNYDATVKAIEAIRETVLSQNKPVILYFEHVERLEPSATLLLTAEIFRCRNLRPFGKHFMVQGTYPKRMDVFLQLREMGFYDLIGVDARDHIPDDPESPDRPWFLRFHSFNRAEPTIPRELSTWINDNAIPLTDVQRRRMNEALKEAMYNTQDHAYEKSGEWPRLNFRWWLGGFIIPANNEMMLILVDQGIGIPESLSAHPGEMIRSFLTSGSTRPSDAQMIQFATTLFRTSTGESGRGRGFRDMKRFVDESADGDLRVLSNRGCYHYMKEGEQISNFDRSIGGTLLEWRIQQPTKVENGAA